MKIFCLLVFVLLIQLSVAKKSSERSGSSGSKDSSGSSGSKDSSGSSGSKDSSGSSGSKDCSGSSDSEDSSESSGSDSSSDSHKHKNPSTKADKSKNNVKKSDTKQNDLETILTVLPNPLNSIGVTITISINSITSSLTNIRSQSGALSKLSQQITSIFDILSKVKGVTNMVSTFRSAFDKITLTFSSVESELGRSVVDTIKKAVVDIQASHSGLLLLISTKAGSLNDCDINNFVKVIAENIQVLISVVQATTSIASEPGSTFNSNVFQAIVSLQLIISPVLYAVQWVLSLTAFTSLSVNGTISPELSGVTLAVSTILQNISKIIVTISNATSGNFSKIVNSVVSPVTKLSSSVNTSLSPISGTIVNVTIKKEQITSNTATTKFVYSK